MYTSNIPVDLLGGLAVIVAMGWALGAIGDALPIFNKFGASTILAILVLSILVLFNLLPQNSIDAVNLFMGDISFQNLYIFALVSGSILGMNRNTLVQGFSRMLLPMATGFILAIFIPSTIGWLLGLGFQETLFFIITPAMGGGIAGGVLPLALGYSSVTGMSYGELVTILTPASILANFFAIGGAAIMNQMGEQKPSLTGNGTLVKSDALPDLSEEEREKDRPISYQLIGTGLFLVLTLYIVGTILENITGSPTAVIVIFIATILKYFQILPQNIEHGAVQFF